MLRNSKVNCRNILDLWVNRLPLLHTVHIDCPYCTVHIDCPYCTAHIAATSRWVVSSVHPRSVWETSAQTGWGGAPPPRIWQQQKCKQYCTPYGILRIRPALKLLLQIRIPYHICTHFKRHRPDAQQWQLYSVYFCLNFSCLWNHEQSFG